MTIDPALWPLCSALLPNRQRIGDARYGIVHVVTNPFSLPLLANGSGAEAYLI